MRFPFPKWAIWLVVILIALAFFASVVFLLVFRHQQRRSRHQIRSARLLAFRSPASSRFRSGFRLVKIKTSSVAITVDDGELITSDKQRIGLQVSADVFRPTTADVVISNYARYKPSPSMTLRCSKG
jgi:hypothetical protein